MKQSGDAALKGMGEELKSGRQRGMKIFLGAGVDVSAEWRPVQFSLTICSASRPIVVTSMLSL